MVRAQRNVGDMTAFTEHDQIDSLQRRVRELENTVQSLEQQLGRRVRTEALGKLAGGLANDFNNLLSVILGYGQFALEGLPEDASIRDELRQVLHAGERATVLTRQLLALSRCQHPLPCVVDLSDELIRVQRVLKPLLGAEIEVVVQPSAAVGHVSIDADHLEQILIHLACNAQEAMPAGGQLFLGAEDVIVKPEGAVSERAGREAQDHHAYVALRVRDTGRGMPPEVKQRLFEPLFTTKHGQSAGMGLTTTLCIVRDAGGYITVDSAPGMGTTVNIHLPRAHEQAKLPVRALASEPLRGGDQTVLLVEDEPGVLKLAQRVLASHGYNVLRARNGAEALEVSDQHQGTIHLLLTDLIMPQMGGEALAKHFLARRPEARVLYMTGYSPQIMDVADGPTWLQKPLRAAELLMAVRAVLDAGCATASS
jgi:signal transduction histidine kinase